MLPKDAVEQKNLVCKAGVMIWNVFWKEQQKQMPSLFRQLL
jgi:hypothetical protein